MIVKNIYAYSPTGKLILNNVSLSAKKGDIIAIVGKSGAGKSTLLRAISGVGISYLGTVSHAKKIGFLYQDGKQSLSPAHTILSQAVEYIGKTAEAKKWFMRVGLLDKIKSYSDLLSGGQRMRASLAINMHRGASVLLLDEPTANLDDDNKKIVIDVLLSDVKKNKTILLWVTHDLELAKKVATRIIVLESGKVVEDTNAKKFFISPTTKQGKELLKKTDIQPNKSVGKNIICQVKNLTAGYDKKIILDAISFDIMDGQSLGLYGQSGVGKTTLLRVLTGQIKQNSGTVKIPESVQVIFQDASSALNPKLSVFTSVAEPLEYSKMGRGMSSDEIKFRVERALKMVNIKTSNSSRYPHQFSGGQLMRICIARAIVAKPSLILADEITASLDPQTAHKVLKSLLKVQKETGVSILYVSHNKKLLKQISHKVLKVGL